MKVLPISCRCKLTALVPQVRQHLYVMTASRGGAQPAPPPLVAVPGGSAGPVRQFHPSAA